MKPSHANKFKPSQGVFLVTGSEVLFLEDNKITPEMVGLKAYGLSAIPAVWTLPFFVISGSCKADKKAIKSVLNRLKVKENASLIVRSSGVDEVMEARGRLDSKETSVDKVLETISNLQATGLHYSEDSRIHWVVQVFEKSQIKGHLSNERRLSEAQRDWAVETETASFLPSEFNKISLREWRDSRSAEIDRLKCNYKVDYLSVLESVAKWGFSKKKRLHFEWVWNGSFIYIVQADECDKDTVGVNPADLLKSFEGKEITLSFSVFRVAEENDFFKYKKLANARLYKEVGYSSVCFFVLNCSEVIKDIVVNGLINSDLEKDLEELTKLPLVIRVDGGNIPEKQKQMLPRSNELRDLSSAKNWLINDFGEKVKELELEEAELCLIAHHFIPAAASAWSQAHPDRRRVRIESLWGLPEGLYWYAHDVFDVDTKVLSTKGLDKKPDNFLIKERLRYKGRFVAPNRDGQWVVHQTAPTHDWKRSITRTGWIEEIAWSSRKIAEKAGHSVVVMWFIDIRSSFVKDSVIPWYHEEWKHDGLSPKAAPRKKVSTSEELVVRTKADWQELKSRSNSDGSIARVIIEPIEPDLVRDQKFAQELASLANSLGFVIELSGGLLSHAYYMLTSSGCYVECSDLYAAEEGELEFHKLVRDKVPENIFMGGENVRLLRLKGEALIKSLKVKIVEESLEICDAKTTQEVVEEIADLREVLDALVNVLSLKESDIKEAMNAKKIKSGAFDEALMLERTSLVSSLNLSEDKEDPFSVHKPIVEKTIYKEEQLPFYAHELHSDKRYNDRDVFERQLSGNLPAHAERFLPRNVKFSLETSDGESYEYILDMSMERKGADLKFKMKIINAPVQMKLDI